jgi:hypothetical protein
VIRFISGFIDEPLRGDRASNTAQTGPDGIPVNCANTPDIYYIILDGYGRADVLNAMYG